MKKLGTAAALMILSANTLSATLHNGLRVSFQTGTSTFSEKLVFKNGYSNTETTEESYQGDFRSSTTCMSVGYQNLNINKLGYSILLNKEDFDTNGPDRLSRLMIEGNINYAFNERLYSSLGANISDYSTAEENCYCEFGIDLGFQTALGVVISKNISSELKLTRTSHFADIGYYTQEIESDQLTIGLNITF